MPLSKLTTPVKLLHVTGDSRFGGAAAIILGLSRVARSEGWQVDILTTDPTFQQILMRQGFGLVNLDVIRRPIAPLWDLLGLFRLVRFLRSHRYHIVHTHTSKGGFIGRLAARLAGVPVIIHTVHGFAFHEASPPSERMFYAVLERIASHWCNQIVSVSEFHRDWAVRLGMCRSSRIIAIPNGIAPPHQSADGNSVRRNLGVPSDDLLILSVSRLAPDKGVDYLLQAAAMIPRSRHIRLAIAGDGLERPNLERLAYALGIADRVLFLGFRNDIPDLLAASDIVVLPTLREGLSISLLEAMAAGRPIVTTTIGSQLEVASHGEMACLVPPADSRSLHDAICRLADDSALRTRLAANTRAVYESYYTEQRMLQSYRQLYLRLLGTSSPPETPCEELARLRLRNVI